MPTRLQRKNTREPERVRGALLSASESRNKAYPSRKLVIEWKNMEAMKLIGGTTEEIKNNNRLSRSIS